MTETAEPDETTELGRAIVAMVGQSRAGGRWIDWRGDVWEYVDYVRTPYWYRWYEGVLWPHEMTLRVVNEFHASGVRRLPITYRYGVEETYHPSGTVFAPRDWEPSRFRAGITYGWIDKSSEDVEFWMCRKRLGALEKDGYERLERITNDTPI